MSDWTEAIANYEVRNWENLAIKFIEKYDDEWYEFISEEFFNNGCV